MTEPHSGTQLNPGKPGKPKPSSHNQTQLNLGRQMLISQQCKAATELMNNKLLGLSPPGGLVSPSGGFASLLFDQVGHFASIKLSHKGAIIKIPVVRCHYL